MLERFEALHNFSVYAGEDKVAKLTDLLFDDQSSRIRYLVCDTGGWFRSREVLLAPQTITSVDHDNDAVHTDLSKDQIEKSPPISSHQPVSRQEEARLHEHYAWDPYWATPMAPGPYFWAADPGLHSVPAAAPRPHGEHPPSTPAEVKEAAEHQVQTGDNHLRSAHEVVGYHVGTNDGEDAGKVKDLFFALDDWQIRYLLVDTGTIFSGKHVLVPTNWLKSVEWANRIIVVDHDREAITKAPDFAAETVSPDHERELEERLGQTLPWTARA